jgi:hypothetical protein
MADHHIVDSQKILYMMADKWQVKCEKNPGGVIAFTSLWSQSRQLSPQTCNGRSSGMSIIRKSYMRSLHNGK